MTRILWIDADKTRKDQRQSAGSASSAFYAINFFAEYFWPETFQISLAPRLHANAVQKIARVTFQIRLTNFQNANPFHLSKPQSFSPGDAPVENEAQQDYQLAERG